MNKFFDRLVQCTLLTVLVCVADAAVGQKASFGDTLGRQHISGPKYSEEDLRGKVIFYEYWGLQCPPCRAAMPHLQEMYDKYKSRGFVVIGAHSQFFSPAVQTYLKDNKLTFPNYQFARLPEAPCPGGLPYSVLIGADGKIVAEGYPSSLYSKVEEEIAKVEKGLPILGDVELKKYKSLSKSVNSKSNNIEAKILPFRSKRDDDEAQAICAAYDAWLAGEKSRVESLCESNPLLAMKSISRLKAQVPSVTDFDEKLASFKSNSGLQKLADLSKKLSAIKKRAEKGRKVSSVQVQKLQDEVASFKDSQDTVVQTAAALLESEIQAFLPEER